MRITASRLERLDLCPGSLAAEEGLSDRTTQAGESGQRIHDCLAAYWRPDELPHTLTDSEGDLMTAYINEANHLIGERGGRPSSLLIEERIEGPDGYSGQPDLVALWLDQVEPQALVLDWKSGWLEQEASTSNLQLRAYAVLVGLTYGVAHVDVALLQRNATTIVTKYDAEDLIKARVQIIEIIREASAPGAVRTPGERQCRYCKAVGVCPEALDSIASSLAVARNGSGIPIHPTLDPLTASQIARCLSGDQLAEIHSKKRVAELVFEAVDYEIKIRLARDPLAVPGWTLKPGNKRRVIKDPAAAFVAVSQELSSDDFLGCCTVRLVDLELAFKRAIGKSRAESDRILDGRLRPAVEVAENAPSIVKAK
jgi:hypothetical protein